MAIGDKINFKPSFELATPPCDGDVGDLVVLSPLKEGELDLSDQGKASLWLCVKSGRGERPAVWAHVHLDGIATCEAPVPLPPQDLPVLRERD